MSRSRGPPDADAVVQQLHRQMPVAEMPGDPHQFAPSSCAWISSSGLRPGAHPHHAAVLDRQPVAIAQPHRLRQVEQYLPALLGRAAAMRRRWRRSKSISTRSISAARPSCRQAAPRSARIRTGNSAAPSAAPWRARRSAARHRRAPRRSRHRPRSPASHRCASSSACRCRRACWRSAPGGAAGAAPRPDPPPAPHADTKVRQCSASARPNAPNIGR